MRGSQVLEIAAGDMMSTIHCGEDRRIDRIGGAARPVGQDLLVEIGKGNRNHVDLGMIGASNSGARRCSGSWIRRWPGYSSGSR
jgi:hypothetical protein